MLGDSYSFGWLKPEKDPCDPGYGDGRPFRRDQLREDLSPNRKSCMVVQGELLHDVQAANSCGKRKN